MKKDDWWRPMTTWLFGRTGGRTSGRPDLAKTSVELELTRRRPTERGKTGRHRDGRQGQGRQRELEERLIPGVVLLANG